MGELYHADELTRISSVWKAYQWGTVGGLQKCDEMRINAGLIPRNRFEEYLNKEIKNVPVSLFNTKNFYYTLFKHCNYYDSASYFTSLDNAEDPRQLVRLLILAPCAGLIQTEPGYIDYCKAFRNRTLALFLKYAHDISYAAQLNDEPTVKRILAEATSYGSTLYSVIDDQETVYETITYDYPKKTNSFKPQGWRPSSITHSLKLPTIGITDKWGTAAIELSLRDYLKRCIDESIGIVKTTPLTLLAAKAAQLQDPNATIASTPNSTDPYQNPFLVYDPALSQQNGVPTFIDTSTNSVRTFAPKPVTSSSVPTVKYFEMAPDLIGGYTRSVALPGGGYGRPIDLEPNKPNYMPLLILGGLVAAYGISEVL
jgi:hypothetical protein